MRDRSTLNTLLLGLIELALLLGVLYVTSYDEAALGGFFAVLPWRNLAVFVAIVALLNLLTRLIKLLYRRRNYARRRGAKNFVYGVENIRKLLIAAVVVFTLLSLMGIDFRTLFTSLSIVAAAIAIVSKDFVNDLIIGIYYSFTDVFEVGDYVRFHGRKGKVVDIGLLKVSLLNDNDDTIIMPNSKIYADEIVNYTRRDVRLMSIDFEMDIRFVPDMNTLEKDLIQTLEPYAERIEQSSYLLKIVEVKKDYLELKFQFRLLQDERRAQRETKRLVVREVFSYVTTHSNPEPRELQN